MMTDKELEELASKCCEELDRDYYIGNAPYNTVLYYLKQAIKINEKETSCYIDNLQVNTDRDY